jgi:6-phosphogluconolactonase/glucosamine-6-phosphate isomerase/deaminase
MTVKVYATRDEMGKAVAAVCAGRREKDCLPKRKRSTSFSRGAFPMRTFSSIFSSNQPGVDWARMNAFVMDDIWAARGIGVSACNFAQKQHLFKGSF